MLIYSPTKLGISGVSTKYFGKCYTWCISRKFIFFTVPRHWMAGQKNGLLLRILSLPALFLARYRTSLYFPLNQSACLLFLSAVFLKSDELGKSDWVLEIREIRHRDFPNVVWYTAKTPSRIRGKFLESNFFWLSFGSLRLLLIQFQPHLAPPSSSKSATVEGFKYFFYYLAKKCTRISWTQKRFRKSKEETTSCEIH